MLNYTLLFARQKKIEMKYLILIFVLCFILWLGVAFWWMVWMLFGTYGIIGMSILLIITLIYIRYSDVEGDI